MWSFENGKFLIFPQGPCVSNCVYVCGIQTETDRKRGGADTKRKRQAERMQTDTEKGAGRDRVKRDTDKAEQTKVISRQSSCR